MISPSPRTTISAQPGPQTAFLQTAADICIYGGAAGGGKTVGLILEPLKARNPQAVLGERIFGDAGLIA
jgi:hypothetical protein